MSAAGTSIAASLIGALSALALVAPATQAQRIDATVDAGAMALRYADTLNTGAFNLTPHVVADWGSAFADASATFSQFSAGGRSGQGALSLSRFLPATRGVFGELSLFGGGSAHSDGARTGEILASARLHKPIRIAEIFVGTGAGRTYDGNSWRTFIQGEAGTSWDVGAASTLLSVTPTVVNDSIGYADVQGVLTWKRDRMEIASQGGFRIGNPLLDLGSDQKVWLSANAVYTLTRTFAVVASGGTYPVDPTEGFPGGRFLSLGMRLTPGRRARPETPPPLSSARIDSEPTELGASVATSFTAMVHPGGSVEFQVRATNAERVEITGDFTSWTPRALSPAGAGMWTITLPLNAGKYQMNLRLDGGPWIAPPSLMTMLDEFGGRVGLLVVEK